MDSCGEQALGCGCLVIIIMAIGAVAPIVQERVQWMYEQERAQQQRIEEQRRAQQRWIDEQEQRIDEIRKKIIPAHKIWLDYENLKKEYR